VKKTSSPPLLARFTQLFRKSGGADGGPQSVSEAKEAHKGVKSNRSQVPEMRRNDAIRAREFNRLRKVLYVGRDFPLSETMGLPGPAKAARINKNGNNHRDTILDKIDGAQAHLEKWWNAGSGHGALTTQPTPLGVASAPAQSYDELDLDFTDMQALSAEEDQTEVLSPVDAALREAAMMYAEGEFDTAQSALAGPLSDSALDLDTGELLTASLFDVYRCAGQHERFDALALEYAKRFRRSPPRWFSFETLAPPLTGQGHATAESGLSIDGRYFWKCPSILTADALAQCRAQQPSSAQSCAINWLALQLIDGSIAQNFAELVAAWSKAPQKMYWLGTESLVAALQKRKISGNAAANRPWWLIQMDVLRILQREKKFEELALEYCVIYEVSPPSWSPVACTLQSAEDLLQAGDILSGVGPLSLDGADSTTPPHATVELHGNVIGDSDKKLGQLHKASAGASQVTVSCAHLGRIDFKAAAVLMDWVKACDASGCQVQFIHLPRLVLVYFHMLGMEPLASLSTGSS
jgi:ABC-type transporter Mla MlaB component